MSERPEHRGRNVVVDCSVARHDVGRGSRRNPTHMYMPMLQHQVTSNSIWMGSEECSHIDVHYIAMVRLEGQIHLEAYVSSLMLNASPKVRRFTIRMSSLEILSKPKPIAGDSVRESEEKSNIAFQRSKPCRMTPIARAHRDPGALLTESASSSSGFKMPFFSYSFNSSARISWSFFERV